MGVCVETLATTLLHRSQKVLPTALDKTAQSFASPDWTRIQKMT
jgi:hypothetical protein